MDAVNFSISLSTCARKLVNSSNDSETSSFYLTYKRNYMAIVISFRVIALIMFQSQVLGRCNVITPSI